jgi:two-component system copper resistance phosphate regulon response regulator CusR
VRVLVVEDQAKMASFLKRGLKEAGYAVDVAESGSAAESLCAESEYDLVILDVMLPDQNGIDTARHMRRDGYGGPILMLTALGSTQDKVRGLDAGADDYLTKPYSMEELLARARALFRRKPNGGGQATVSKLQYSDLEMDLLSRRVSRQNTEITLTTREFALLEYFMRHAEHPLSRTSISEHVWDIHFDTESNVIDVYVNMLRKKVDQPFGARLIHTVIGVGYVLKT